MTTLKEVRRHIYELAPDLVGRLEAVASLTTTTVVVTALATGGYGDERFRAHWLLRAEAASAADRVRKVSSFAAATGTLTHGGASYADTTATSEYVEIIGPEYQPHLLDREINHILGICRRLGRTILPGINGLDRYWLHDLPWLTEPSNIIRVCQVTSPVLSRNRYFEQWNGYSTAGALIPDWWTLGGSGATMARSTTGARKGQYSIAITRSGADASLTQDVGLLANGTAQSGSSLRGQTVTAVLVGMASAANQLRVTVNDGVTSTSSSYHGGGGGIEELTAEHILSATASQCEITVEVNGTDGTAYADEAYLVFGTLTDSARLDRYHEWPLAPRDIEPDQGNGTLSLRLPRIARGQQYVLYTGRPYPRLDSARLLAGSADGDVIDAPKELIAAGALWRIHEALGSVPGAEAKYLQVAATWRARYDTLAAAHISLPSDHDGGVPLPVAMVGGRPPGRG